MKNQHDTELMDEGNDIYECRKCGKTGKYMDFQDECPSGDTTPSPESPHEGSLLSGILSGLDDDFFASLIK